MCNAIAFAARLKPHLCRTFAATIAAALLLPLAGSPASAANFFEKLFGVQQAPRAAPRASVVLPPPVLPVQRAMPDIRKEKPKSKIVKARPAAAPTVKAVAVRPEVLPGPLGPFLLDPTLRRGDVVVTSEGLKVFAGQGGRQHSQGDFVALAHANRFAAGNSSLLAAIDRANRFSAKPLIEVQAVPMAKPVTPVASGKPAKQAALTQ